MKRILMYFAPMVLVLTIGFFYFYPTTIMVVQTVPNDSLLIGHDRSLKLGDTVTVTGRVVAPAVVNASGNDFRVLLRVQTPELFTYRILPTVFGAVLL
jgi:hypothetical protein